MPFISHSQPAPAPKPRTARSHNLVEGIGEVELSAISDAVPASASHTGRNIAKMDSLCPVTPAPQPSPKCKRKKPFAANLASEKALTADGWTVCRVEQRIPGCFITRDAFGFGDLLCCSPTRGIMLVQVTGGTSTSNFHARVAKIKAEARAGIWLAAGGRIQVHSHETQAGTKVRKCRILEITKP